MEIYKYGMRLRGFSPGCQPMNGIIKSETDPLGKYWNILFYSRQLTDDEIKHYSMDYLGEVIS